MMEACKRSWKIYRRRSWEELRLYGLPTLSRCTRVEKDQR